MTVKIDTQPQTHTYQIHFEANAFVSTDKMWTGFVQEANGVMFMAIETKLTRQDAIDEVIREYSDYLRNIYEKQLYDIINI